MFQNASCLSTSIGCFCEEFSEGINQPINSITSLVFVFVGLYLLIKNIHKENKILSVLFSISLIITGLGSAYYHARFNMLGQTMDFLGIYMILIAGPIAVLNNKSTKYKLLTFLLSSILIGLFLMIIPEIRRYVFLVSVASLIFFERKRFSNQLRNALVVFVLGLTVWIVDNCLIYCSLLIFLNMHAWWHILTAVAAYLLFKHFNHVNNHNPKFSKSS